MRFALSLCVIAASTVLAQPLTGVFTPQTATAGTPVVLRVSNGGTQSLTLTSGCGYNAVIAGSPAGATVFQPLICPFILITIGPCQSRNVNVNIPSSLVPGQYYVRIDYRIGANTAVVSDYFPFAIPAAGAPTLASTTPAQIGTSLLCTLNAPGFGGGYYIMAASFSANTGFAVTPTLYVALDLDLLFNLSFPAPDPTLFTNFQDGLSPTGTSNTIAVNIPNLPALSWLGMVLQGVAFDGVGNPALTNPLSFTFTP